MQRERRRSSRIPLEHVVEVKYQDKEFKTNTLNLSGHGLLILSPVHIKPGEELELIIKIPGKAIHAHAKGIWCKKEDNGCFQLGVCFIKMPQDERRWYVNYICENILNFFIDEKGKIREL